MERLTVSSARKLKIVRKLMKISAGFDLPDMFRQMTEKLWKQFSKERPSEDIRIPDKILMECNELVLNGDTMEEVQRLPGENDVRISLAIVKL